MNRSIADDDLDSYTKFNESQSSINIKNGQKCQRKYKKKLLDRIM